VFKKPAGGVLAWRSPNKEAGLKTRPATSRLEVQGLRSELHPRNAGGSEPTAVGVSVACKARSAALPTHYAGTASLRCRRKVRGLPPLRHCGRPQKRKPSGITRGFVADFFGASPSHRPGTSAQAPPRTDLFSLQKGANARRVRLLFHLTQRPP